MRRLLLDKETTGKGWLILGEALATVATACAVGFAAKWAGPTLLVFVLGRGGADDPSNWDLIRLIAFYSGIVAGALFLLWRVGRRRRSL